MTTIRCIVNGKPQALAVDPRKRLADVLRDDLGLTGTKIGCNAGDCGACTVHIDAHQACACITPVGQVEGAAVTTIEGLTSNESLTRLQQAFLQAGAAQCGICTPGMLMAASDLLARVPVPNRAQIANALGGVLCRCTGYQKIIEAVELCASGVEIKPLIEPEVGAAVGARVAKVDGVAKLTGREGFGADGIPADALWLRVVRSPHHRARFAFGDLGAWQKAHPGVLRMLTAGDVPSNGFGIYPTIKDQPVLAQGEVRFKGEAVLAIVGERAAIEALDLSSVPIHYTPLPVALGIEAAKDAASRGELLHADKPGNILQDGGVRKGDIASGLAHAAARTEVSVTTHFVEHAYIEPEAGWARRVELNGQAGLEIHVTTQTPYMDRDEVAVVMRIPPEQVRIVPTACGGGFGGKLDMSVQPLIALAAWLLPGRAVACVYTRPESMASTTKRHPSKIALTLAADAKGKLLACESHAEFDTGAYASWGPTVATRVPIHATGPYCVPNVATRGTAYYTHSHPSGAFRGFGVPQGAIAHEAAMDGLADQLGMDRLEFRYLNALRVGDATATGQVLQASAGLAQCLEALRPHWRSLKSAATLHNAIAKHTRRGVGIGCMYYGIGNTALSNPSTMRLSVSREGITLYNGAADIGQGSSTILAQIAADAARVPLAELKLVVSDTGRTPDAGKSSASRQTFVSGQAAQRAGVALRETIAKRLGISAQDVIAMRVDDNELRIISSYGEKRLSLADEVIEAQGHFDPPTTPADVNGQGTPYATYAFAAQVALVEVDVELGTTRVLRMVAAHDVGRAINPTQVEGQIQGGILQGLGLALMEEYIPGKTENLHDYLIPSIGDAPDMDILLVEDPEPLGPSGAKGVGEPGLVPTAPAILGAIDDAVRVRMLEVPVLPHRLQAALRKKAATSA